MGDHAGYYQPRIAYEHVRKLYGLGQLLKKPMTRVLADILEAAFQDFVFTEEDQVTGRHATIPTYRAKVRDGEIREPGRTCEAVGDERTVAQVRARRAA
jgi:hypothetical protein